jgi:hypothetical protein
MKVIMSSYSEITYKYTQYQMRVLQLTIMMMAQGQGAGGLQERGGKQALLTQMRVLNLPTVWLPLDMVSLAPSVGQNVDMQTQCARNVSAVFVGWVE